MRESEAIELGRENQRGIDLMRDFCTNAEIRVAVSPMGRAVGLPIGRAEIRCAHAPFFGLQMMQATDLAVEFYEANCINCSYRQTAGRLPNIASEAAERARRRENDEEQRLRERDAVRSAWTARNAARNAALADAPFQVRDLAAQIDFLDACPEIEEERLEEARRYVVETARATPTLFVAPLVDALFALAAAHDATAHEALLALARGGVAEEERVVTVAVDSLREFAIAQAGATVAAFAALLRPEQCAAACYGAIALTAEPDHFLPIKVEPKPAALLALAAVAWPIVESAVIDFLAADEDVLREVGARAAGHLLCEEVARLQMLGEPLVRSIRGRDAGYAGHPAPGSAAVGALADAWIRAPQATVEVVERHAGAISPDAREVLADVGRVVMVSSRDGHDAEEAALAAMDCYLRRLEGDWGDDVASTAAREVESAVEWFPAPARRRAYAIFGALIRECTSERRRPSTLALTPPEIAQMEAMGGRINADSRRRNLAEALGRIIRGDDGAILRRVLALLPESVGNEVADRRVRVTVLRVLTEATTVENVAQMLPRLYTWLLAGDPEVRAAAIRLWLACARAADALPNNLEALVPALLTDSYLAVHGTMVEVLPRLAVSDRLRRGVLGMLLRIAAVHCEDEHASVDILYNALAAVLWAADVQPVDGRQNAARFVVASAQKLARSDREKVLLWRDLAPFRSDAMWAAAALEALAQEDRVTVVGRDEPLLVALLEEPRGLREISLDRFETLAFRALPERVHHVESAVALLQAAGRWGDAAAVSTDALGRVPVTVEFEGRRRRLEWVAASCAAEAAVSAGTEPAPFMVGAAGDASFLVHARARSMARAAIRDAAIVDPAQAAAIVEQAARDIAASPDADGVSAAFGRALEIVAQLLRYDAALRAHEPAAASLLASAHRNAAVFAQTGGGGREDAVQLVTFALSAARVTDQDLDAVIGAAARLAVTLPFAEAAFPYHQRVRPTTDAVAEPEPEPAPVLVCVPSLLGAPVSGTLVVRPQVTFDLTLDVRLEAWPEDATYCEISVLTPVSAEALQVPTFRLTPEMGERDGYGLRFTQTGSMMLRAERPLGAEPLDLPLHARFVGAGGSSRRALLAGYRRIRIVPYDPGRHVLTGFDQIDEQLLLWYAPLYEDRTLNEDDVRAFCRFFTACMRAAKAIQFDRSFRKNAHVTEKQFHDALYDRLLADPELGGRVTRRNPLGGGFDDLQHDGIDAEVKVAKTAAAAADRNRYVGQPVQYAVDLASRLSILIVFDHSPKANPPRVFENDFYWVEPVQHGGETPFPSRVGKLVITTNWPVPSWWSRLREALGLSSEPREPGT
jgi:hypothetical protein